MTGRRAKATLLAAALTLGLAALASAQISQHGDLRVAFTGALRPHALPRSGSAPVKVSVGGTITTTDGASPPQLQKISIAINRQGRLSSSGLPSCTVKAIQPSTTAGALAACRRSLVGEGQFSAKVLLPEQSPFPSEGKVFAFNGTFEGRPAILAHVYGTQPAPTSSTIPFVISRAHGAYGTLLSASLPQVTGDWGYVTGLSLTLGRTYRYRGRTRSYLSASCPAPKGFPGAVFVLAKAGFAFPEQTLSSTLTRSCAARG